MTGKKMVEVLDSYIKFIENLGIAEVDSYAKVEDREEILGYLLSMCKRTKGQVEEGGVGKLDRWPGFIRRFFWKIGKVNRWLGFIQGSFWILRIYSIDEMRDHNRS